MNFSIATHDVTQEYVWPLRACMHAPDESEDGVLGDLLPDLDHSRNCLHTLAT